VSWRWAVVVLAVVALAAAPSVVARLPVDGTDVSAADLLARVQGSSAVPYSGYAQSTGGVVLPVTDQLSSLTNLLGDTTTLRTWFRGPDRWRVDTVLLTGERDLYRDGLQTWSWDYEADRAVLSTDPALRLPREADLLPTELGRRLLSEADPSEVSRLPAVRVAGVDAPGLRLVPRDARTTVSEVDVWVEPGTGLPLRVDVLGDGATRPVVTTSFLDFSTAVPDAATTSFTPPPGAEVQRQGPTDLAALADQYAHAVPPTTLAGLPARDRVGAGAVGIYGRGVTLLAAIPLRGRDTRGLRDQLTATPGAVVDANGVGVGVGPLNLRLTPRGADGTSWIVSGTVTADTLTAAAQQLVTGGSA
jgi:outer membrane lipoprotein-sorting protein